MSADDKIASVRQRWDDFSERFTATANRRVTIQCARELHAHMALDSAQSVLEVAAGAGLGSLDILARMTSGDNTKSAETRAQRQLTVTDLAPRMVALAKETLAHAATESVAVRVMEANGTIATERMNGASHGVGHGCMCFYVSVVEGPALTDCLHLCRYACSLALIAPWCILLTGQELTDVATGSMDRFIANMCLQLTPDADAMLRETKRVLTPDGVAGFTIWGRPERSGIFTIDAAATKELGLGDGAEHSNFALGRDLVALRQRFAAAGFSRVRVWPFQCVLAVWSGDEYAAFQRDMSPLQSEDDRARLSDVWKRMGDEWLATTGVPIGLEAYIVVARA